MQPKSLPAHCGSQKYQQESSLCFTLHEVCLKSLPRMQAAILNQIRWMPSQLSAARLPKSILARLPLVTLNRTVYPGMHLPLQLRCRLRAPDCLSLCA
jgi:hypothetical protein